MDVGAVATALVDGCLMGLSRQALDVEADYMRDYSVARVAAGRCVSCGDPLETKRHCSRCAARHRATQRAMRQKPEEKLKRVARESVRKGLKCGTLVKPPVCTECGQPSAQLQAHHYKGYKAAFRRVVRWLCQKCHGKEKRHG